MLEGLRRHMKAIIWMMAIVFVALIFFGWGMRGGGWRDEKNYVAKINNKKITHDEFRAIYRSWADRYRRVYGDAFDDEMSEELRRNIIDNIIFGELLYQKALAIGIKVAKYEIEEAVKIQPIFQNEQGQFDPARYEQGKRMLPKNWWAAQRKESRKMLLGRKLELRIRNTIKVSGGDVRRYYRERRSPMKINYIQILRSSFSKVRASEEEIKEHYDRHKEEYRRRDQVKTKYLAARKPAEEDIPDSATRNAIISSLKKTMEEALKDLMEEKNLKSVGKKHNLEIDETPFFEKTQFIDNPDFQIFVRAAFTLSDPGELTEIVESPSYFYILSLVKRIDAHIPSLNEIGEELGKAVIDLKQSTLAKNKAIEIYGRLSAGQEKGFSSEIKSTPFFTMEDEIPGLGEERHLKREILDLKVGKWSNPLRATGGYCLIKVIERKLPAEIEGGDLDELRQELLLVRQYMVLEEWVSNLKKKAKIENVMFPEEKAGAAFAGEETAEESEEASEEK